MSPSSSQKSTSVFQALGSYADRIKEQRTAKASRALSPNPSSSQSSAMTARNSVDDDGEGSWETVRTGRNKSRPERQEEKRGSNSRNWRERAGNEDKDATSKEDEGSKKSSPTKKGSTSPSAPTSKNTTGATSSASTPTASSSTPPTGSTTASTTPKAAWGAASPVPAAATVESSQSVDSTGATEAQTSSKAADEKEAAIKSDADADGSWRARPKQAETAAAPVTVSAPAKAAPPPAVNAWNLKKPVVASSSLAGAPTPAQAASASTVTAEAAPTPAAQVNGEAKGSTKKHRKKGDHPPSVADSSLWPDVVQATRAEDSKGKPEKKAVEVVEDAPQSATIGKKQKWKAIPAAELQEAADKVAETSRRQAKQKQRQAKGDTDSVESKGGRGKKQSAEAKKAPRMQRSASQGSEARSQVEGQRANGFREPEKAANGELGINGVPSAAHSTSRPGTQSSSKRGSPLQPSTPLSPESGSREPPSAGSLPHAGFNPTAGLPRPPRGRDREGRGGYAGRGRGNNRSASNTAMQRMYAGELSPLGGNASLYPAGYGVGYGGFYPVPAPGYALAPGFDASQGTYNGVPVFPRGMPPPPMPVTQITNIDPQRFYVLGQVEYYFSMQNLAMDFFLRQQMDAEGWIDIAMIASFNRIKSLTPYAAIVREVMVLSSLLEVSGDKVRLAGGEAKRWVLPDAKPSGPAHLSPKKGSDATEISHGIPVGVGQDANASALGMEDMGIPTSPVPKFDVENALMKSSGSANVSSTASVLASEEDKTATPATSVTDEKSENEEEKQ